MSPLIAALALPLLFFLPGYVTARALFHDSTALSSGERLFIPIAASVVITTWFGLVLAEFGWFSFAALSILIALYSSLLFLARRSKFAGWPLRVTSPDWVFLAILGLGALLVANPAEYVVGGYDAGTYVNTGANIARTGSIAIQDSLVQSLPPSVRADFYSSNDNPFMVYKQAQFPGFYIADAAKGIIQPQFLPLYSVWLAIFDALLGLRSGLLGTPATGLLDSVACYFVARTLFGRGVARLAFFLLIISVPQFWFGRYPVSELMTGFLFQTGMYAFLRTRGVNAAGSSNGLLPLAGAAFGEVFLSHADSILFLAVLGLYLGTVIVLRLWRRELLYFTLPLAALVVHALAHVWLFAPGYVYFEYTHALRMKNLDRLLPGGLPGANDFFSNPISLLPIGVALIGALVLFLLLDRLVQFLRARRTGIESLRSPRVVDAARWAASGLVVAAFLFAYLIWPRPTPLALIGDAAPLDRSGNLIKLGWYLSPICLALAVLGAVVVIRRDLSRRNVFYFLASGIALVFYLEELYSNPHYIYTIRHYIPLAIPLLILLAVRGLDFMWHLDQPQALSRLARMAVPVSLALWLLYDAFAMGVIDVSRAKGLALRLPFVEQTTHWGPLALAGLGESMVGTTDLRGAFDQLAQLAQTTDPNAVIIFSGDGSQPDLLATPMRYIFGRDALVSRMGQSERGQIAALIDSWAAQGRPVLVAYGTNGGKLSLRGYSLEPAGRFALDVPQWAFGYRYMPREAWRLNLNYALYRPVPRAAPALDPFVVDFGGDDFPYLVAGFMERPAGASGRAIGAVPQYDLPRQNVRELKATLRFPRQADAPDIYLALTARAPQAGMSLVLQNGQARLAQASLTSEYATYQFTIPSGQFRRDADSLLLDLTTSAFADAQGVVRGAELKQAVISTRPLAAESK